MEEAARMAVVDRARLRLAERAAGERRPRRSPDAAALVVLGLLVLGSLAPLYGGAIPRDPDSALFYLPLKAAGAAMLRQGHLALWTPLIGLGYPLLADGEAALLYPPDVALFLLLPPATAFAASIVGHALLGAGLTYAFCRRLRLTPPAALVGALVFTYAGPVLTNIGSPHMSVAAWWPGLLLAVEAVVAASCRRARTRWIVLGALIAAMMHLAGNPQVATYGFLLAGAYALYRAWPLPLAQRIGALGWCAALVALGTALAAPQLLATLELLGQSIRSGGAGQQAGLGSLFPPLVVEMLTPNWRFAAALRVQSPNGYVGIFALALGLLAIWYRRPGARFWAIVVVAAVLLAFGRFTPLFSLTSQLPILQYFRVPARFLYVATAALAVLAALGFDELLARTREGRAVRPLVRVGAALGVVVLAVDIASAAALRLAPDPIFAAVSRAGGTATGGQAATSEFFAAALRASSPADPLLWLPLLGLVGLAVVALTLQPDRRRAVALALAVVAGESLLLSTPLWLALGSHGGSAGLARPATVDAVYRQAAGRIYSFGEPFAFGSAGRHDLLPANENALYGISTIGLYAVMGDPDYRALLEPLGAVNLSYGADPPTPESLAANRRLLDLLGASVLLSPEPLEGFAPAEQVGEARMYQNRSAFPRAWVVGAVLTGSDDVRTALRDPNLDLRRVALVADPVSFAGGVDGEARVVEDHGNAVLVEAAGPGLLVLADRWAPGWHATVDDAPAPIWRVDGILRGVPLAPGAHQITFSYRPEGFGRGVAVALGSGLGLIVLVATVGLADRRLLSRR